VVKFKPQPLYPQGEKSQYPLNTKLGGLQNRSEPCEEENISCPDWNEINIVTYRLIARQRLGKHVPAEAYVRNNWTSIVRQRISKQAFSTIERLVFCVVRAEGL
jgi:hypothetical protein